MRPRNEKRPYLREPWQFKYWKKSPTPKGTGDEVYNYPSPSARRLWLYARSMGEVGHATGWTNEHHGEDGFLLHAIQRGGMWFEINQHRYKLRRGDACLLDLRQDVRYGVEGPDKAKFQWVWINGKDMPAVFLELGADQDPVFPLSDLIHVESLLRELERLTVREPAAYEVKSAGLLTLVLAELFASRGERSSPFALSEETRPLSKPVRMALDNMARHYDTTISLKHVAVDIGKLSLSHFSRLFHREVGMSPIAYLNRYRVEQAKKFLAQGNQSVAEIARSVGFRSLSYFTRTFVRIVGVAPLAYRRNPDASRPSR